MKKKNLYFADKLQLPTEILTQKVSLMGGNGSGKSYATGVIVEQGLAMGGWFIILDYAGIHYGLRLNEDGKTPSGYDIPVFGGLHGDLPLTPESGALIADLLCVRRLSAVLDVSQFETDADFNRFVTAFGKRFYDRMNTNRRAVTVVLEEAQEFLPQNPQEGEKQKLHTWTRIGKIGRNYGIGLIMVSPRPQEISKKVLNLTQTMFAFQMTGTHERKAMDDWCDYVSLETKLSKILPTLEVGECYVASPRTLKFNGRVHVDTKTTYDASATPEFQAGEQFISLSPIDIEELQIKMASLIEKNKENDPEYLRQRISKLEREARERSKFTLTNEKPQIETREVPVFNQEDVKRLMYIRDTQSTLLNESSLLLSKISESLDALLRKANEIETQNQVARVVAKIPPATKERYVHGTPKSNGSTETIKLGKGEQAQLFALMQHGSANRSRLRTITGYKKSSVDSHIKHLRTAGLVVEAGGDIRPTALAWDMFPQYEPLPQGEELIVYWLNNLSQGEKAIFEFILERPREWTSREDIRDKTGYAKSSVDTYIKHMRAKNIIEDHGPIRPHPNLYEI